MIEVEKTFVFPTEGLALGEESSHVEFVDIYFDDRDYSLTRASRWLRSRDGVYELKVRCDGGAAGMDVYEELSGASITAFLFGAGANLEEVLVSRSIEPFARFTTRRTSYRVGEAKLDVDVADFGDFEHRVAEIEIVVERESQVLAAQQAINEIARQLGLAEEHRGVGKLIAYLETRRPHHYRALVKAGAIRL